MGKQIVIQVPSFQWRTLCRVRFGIFFFSLIAISAFCYWYFIIHPFFWISNGRVEVFSTSVCSEISGKIAEMSFEEGDTVKKGQLLFRLKEGETLAEWERVKAVVEGLNQRLQFEKDRMEKAMESYLAANRDIDLGIESQVSLHKHLDILEEVQNESEIASSELAKAQSEYDSLSSQIKKMSVVSSIDGIILQKNKSAGEEVLLEEPVYKICDLNKVWIEAEVPETKIHQIANSASVFVRIPAYPKREWKGVISWIGPAVISKNIPIKISIVNLDIPLKPGLSAQIGLKTP